MRFTRLKLNGFKSFVDPTDLVIADGLTGVVGPNGCGKSNLLEALRWVMGENRPTAMRGGGMEDVIFAGAATRSARNHAEVSLVLDNAERLAPAGFNDSDILEITRRITRDIGSAYKVGTRDVRARDVQMLFADAATGAHSPALVRQGQISELINARPKSRRKVLEDAAGIGGLYQRRHEAELKLRAAEQNLARVDDVIEQLAAQLAQLARQAKQAARYREIGTALRQAEGALFYTRWREADAARLTAEQALREQVIAAARAETAAREAGQAREVAEAALPPLREEEAIAAAVLQRLVVERDGLADEEHRAREAIEALDGRIAQLTRDIEREAGLNRDAGETVAGLEAEEVRLRQAGEGHEDRLAQASEQLAEAAEVLQTRESDLTRLTEDMARLSARHQAAHRLVEDHRKTLSRNEAEATKARAAQAEARLALDAAAAAMADATAGSETAQATAQRAEETLAQADEARSETQGRESDARAARSAAEGEASALRAEVGALEKLVNRDSRDGAQLLDRVEVRPGYEKALGAALADDLRAPVVGPGAVSGWIALPGYPAPAPLPAGVTALTDVVSVPDVLVRRMSQIGLVAAEAGADLQLALLPGQRLVSVEGDLWRWDGFRAGAADAPSAAALRLQQLNRLTELKRDLEEVTARAQGARQAHEALSRRLADLTAADRHARDARREADRLVGEAARALSRAEADRNLSDGKLETAGLALDRFEAEAEGARRALAEAETVVADLGDLSAARGEVEAVRTAVEAARITMMSRRSALDEVRREGEARARRARTVEAEIKTWRTRLDTASSRSAELEDRRSEAQEQLAAAAGKPEEIAVNRARLDAAMEAAEARRRDSAEALAVGETGLREATVAERDAERLAGEAREARARGEARLDAAKESVSAAALRTQEALEMAPQELPAALALDPEALGRAEDIEADVNRLKRQRDALGAVNLRAEEDAREVQEEHDGLVRDKTDLDEAIRTLRAGIGSLNREGRERLLTAFEEVNRNFSALFTHLFGGGEARLELVESDDPLEAGLEIMCQPPGKKLSVLSLLSGGEQTLTALALIFAVFLANPSPICVLDEVDAPLDDANVGRFCDLLNEMTRRTETRFLVITHHAVTMSRMDRLFGVTMGEQGVSQLVSVDLKRAEQMVA
ncbi:chromosome segregation SMC family protein [Roseisalinus antarcticus]|uniref:Chromosome partition protein Smc n=1 Tax=Roseisalinus antarcticus TaxID=254357 RepID=A0A1Y5SN56_9RHOB|nr:AAA family ATPase [Roseisalinus antarcticus]SLN44512.1 Chromosome partition protein Smc [Roseisalinus antarcticus]